MELELYEELDKSGSTKWKGVSGTQSSKWIFTVVTSR